MALLSSSILSSEGSVHELANQINGLEEFFFPRSHFNSEISEAEVERDDGFFTAHDLIQRDGNGNVIECSELVTESILNKLHLRNGDVVDQIRTRRDHDSVNNHVSDRIDGKFCIPPGQYVSHGESECEVVGLNNSGEVDVVHG